MSRHLGHLKSRFQTMRLRDGADDAIVLQVKQALESQDAIESRPFWWMVPCIERRSGDATQRSVASASQGIRAGHWPRVFRCFPLTTLAIGAVKIHRDEFSNAEQVASVAARAKHDAKIHGEGLVIRDNSDFSIR